MDKCNPTPEAVPSAIDVYDLEDPIVRLERFVGLTASMADSLGLAKIEEQGGTRYQRISENDALLLVFAVYEAVDAAKALSKAFDSVIASGGGR